MRNHLLFLIGCGSFLLLQNSPATDAFTTIPRKKPYAKVPKPGVTTSSAQTVSIIPPPYQYNGKPSPTASSSALSVAGGAEVTSIAVANLPTVQKILTTCLIPSVVGLFKYEYTVSYAYGLATSTSAYLIFNSIINSASSPLAALAKIHASAIIFYGIRLNLFLLYREIFIQRFRKFREKVEDRQISKEGANNGLVSKLKSRIPFILSCACLYAGLAAPPYIVAKLLEMGTSFSTEVLQAYKVLVYLSWFGFGLAAIGDLNKSVSKASKGEDHIVTGGVYSIVRHPNYFGEIIGWSSSFFASLLCIVSASSSVGISVILKSLVSPILLASSGLMGILFVLIAATTNLEKKQKEKYGDQEEYKEWVKSSWAGITLKKKD